MIKIKNTQYNPSHFGRPKQLQNCSRSMAFLRYFKFQKPLNLEIDNIILRIWPPNTAPTMFKIDGIYCLFDFTRKKRKERIGKGRERMWGRKGRRRGKGRKEEGEGSKEKGRKGKSISLYFLPPPDHPHLRQVLVHHTSSPKGRETFFIGDPDPDCTRRA